MHVGAEQNGATPPEWSWVGWTPDDHWPGRDLEPEEPDGSGLSVAAQVEALTARLAFLTQVVAHDPVRAEVRQVQTTLARVLSSLEGIERDTRLARLRAPAPLAEATGVVHRPNPMTHPVTPRSVAAPAGEREDAFARVRELFQRRRPWWQRLPRPRGA